ncbi:MAG: glycosyltransferase family 4 protein [Vulcanimicrobiaceae bacterium]
MRLTPHSPVASGADRGRALRVLHVIPTLTGGGAENFLCGLVSCFDERAVLTGIMTVYPTESPQGNEKLSTIPIIKIERRGRYDAGFFGRMVHGMREFRPDIVHAHLHNGKYWGRLAAMVARVPIVVFTEHSPRGEKRILPEIIVDPLVNRLTDAIITFTEHQRQLLIDSEHIPAAKLTVIENGIPLPPLPTRERWAAARRRMGARDDEFAVLVVGRLVPIKNKQLAVRAMEHLSAAARERVRAYIIGTGEEEEMLRELARSAGVADIVRFMGHRDDVVELLYGGDALYMPSLVEGMPLAVLEAMSVGLPVISSPWAGVANLLQGGELGTIISDWEPQNAARAFEDAMSSGAALRRMGEKARAFARERYDIRRIARVHEALYRDLACRKGLLPRLQPTAAAAV